MWRSCNKEQILVFIVRQRRAVTHAMPGTSGATHLVTGQGTLCNVVCQMEVRRGSWIFVDVVGGGVRCEV